MRESRSGARRRPWSPGSCEVCRTGWLVLFDLAADLSAWELGGVDVGVGDAGAHGGDELVELASGDPLARRAEDVGGRDGPGHGAASGWARRLAAAAAEESGDATGRGAGAEVDVGCGHGGREGAQGQPEKERRGVIVELGLERSEPR